MNIKLYVLAILFFALGNLSAQEIRGGEISFNRVGDQTYDVFFDLYYHSLGDDSQPYLLVDFNGFRDSAYLATVTELGNDITLLTYSVTHTFSSTTANSVTVIDTFYLSELKNLEGPNKDMLWFFTILEIPSAIFGLENAPPLFQNLQADYEITDGVFTYTPQGIDPDNDTLFYFVKDFSEFPGYEYSFPGLPSEYFMNVVTGDLIWDRPTEAGKYLIGFDMAEYSVSGIYLGKRERIMIVDIKEEDIVPTSTQNTNMPKFNIFPNPAKGKISLEFPASLFKKNIRLKVFNPLGQVVFEKQMIAAAQAQEINTSTWPPGLYLVTLEAGGHFWTGKVVVR